MRAHEFILNEKRRKKRKARSVAGPYYGYYYGIGTTNDSGAEGGDGGGVEEGELIPWPKGTVKVDVSDVYDWYKLGQHISNLKGLGKHDFGKGTPQARSNASLMFRILSTVIESLDRYIAEYGTPEAFSFAPATPKLGQLYSRLEPRITKKYGYTQVSLVRLGDIASSVTEDDYHSIFQFFDTRGEYFVRNDLVREYD